MEFFFSFVKTKKKKRGRNCRRNAYCYVIRLGSWGPATKSTQKTTKSKWEKKIKKKKCKENESEVKNGKTRDALSIVIMDSVDVHRKTAFTLHNSQFTP